MRATVQVTELGGENGPRLLMLPGLGNRGAGFRPLAEALRPFARPVIVEYPEGRHAAVGAHTLAEQVSAAVGPIDAALGSSFGGMVVGYLAASGRLRGAGFISSFTRLEQLGLRGRVLPAMGPIAVIGRPHGIMAAVAANRWIPSHLVADVVPCTPGEQWGVLHRAKAVPRESPGVALRDVQVHCIALQGTHDLLVPPGTLQRLASSLPAETRTHLIPGAGHVPYLTHVDECVQHLRPWLAEIAAGIADRAAA